MLTCLESLIWACPPNCLYGTNAVDADVNFPDPAQDGTFLVSFSGVLKKPILPPSHKCLNGCWNWQANSDMRWVWCSSKKHWHLCVACHFRQRCTVLHTTLLTCTSCHSAFSLCIFVPVAISDRHLWLCNWSMHQYALQYQSNVSGIVLLPVQFYSDIVET